ncbi:hypothetical protein [Yinghuangia seranimata]|uniref:hypothetical protein n=1 Tax=Yinghuangia seranimata TaxID=408067 RepID=UPI00248C3598|nr:hypothetical protein [Yinghuangia seranimata]MDI2128385.1 hypothetical protein [Yinghuangia seranimata]
MTGVSDGNKNRGTIVLVVSAVVFAVAVLPNVLEDKDDRRTPAALAGASGNQPTGRAPTGPVPKGGLPTGLFPTDFPTDVATAPQRTSAGGGTVAPAPRPTAAATTRNAREEAFASVASNGTCLNTWQTGVQTGHVWSKDPPPAVACGSDSAFVRVIGVNVTNCPETDPGVAAWRAEGYELCLERQFRQGQCFLVKRDGGTQDSPAYSANLFTWVDCDAARIPSEYDSILAITGVYRAPATVQPGVCSRVAGDRTRYWYWVSRDTTLVCATYPNR